MPISSWLIECWCDDFANAGQAEAFFLSLVNFFTLIVNNIATTNKQNTTNTWAKMKRKKKHKYIVYFNSIENGVEASFKLFLDYSV